MVTRERDFLMLAVPEPKTEFNSLGERVFGKSSWKYRLAAHFDINVKNVQRWSDPKGNRQPPERIIEFLREQAKLMQGSGFVDGVAKQVRTAKESGIHPNVVAALLMSAGETEKTSAIPKDKAGGYVPRRLMKERIASEIRQELNLGQSSAPSLDY